MIPWKAVLDVADDHITVKQSENFFDLLERKRGGMKQSG